MTERVQMLSVEWERLRRAFPGALDDRLAEMAFVHGSRCAGADPQPIRHDLPSPERVARLRMLVVLGAATVSEYRFRLVTDRDRLETVTQEERRSFELGLQLDRDLVPPLKLRAKALRAEIRHLEAEARAGGLDPDLVEPVVDWAETLDVDTFEQPRYESGGDRKRAAVEFFRRLR